MPLPLPSLTAVNRDVAIYAYLEGNQHKAPMTDSTDIWQMPHADSASKAPPTQPILGDIDCHLLAEGSHLYAFTKLGAHPMTHHGRVGVGFAVWAPNARRVSVVGDFNGWNGQRHGMRLHRDIGVWELFIAGLEAGALYKYEVETASGETLLKSDPYAMASEAPPRSASVVKGLFDEPALDAAWIKRRQQLQDRHAPIAIYEVHLGSWRRQANGGYLSYDELADQLIPYVADMGFTHIELLPVSEYPFDGSWGYQPTALYAPTRRFGAPDRFRAFVKRCHDRGLGVIMDWVAGHFPGDGHGLARFDGTHLYEHADPRLGRHPEWNTLIYNHGRREVANYLLANALFWIEEYGIDGLRVDAVASMLYRDYARPDGQWLPNAHGGQENLEAIDFLRRLNERVYEKAGGAMTIAEESTAWPMVSRPTWCGGLGFGYKWNMGWMNDTLRYISRDPAHRKYHHDELTFGLLYAFHENFILPLSHDEVVHHKRSLLGKMPGDRWQRFANLRAYLGFFYAHPGKKLLFMGNELAQEREWNHDVGLDWHLLSDPDHAGVQALVRDLNRLYRSLPALHALDCEAAGFQWIDCHDQDNSVISFLRRGEHPADVVVAVCNFTPVVRQGYRIGVPRDGYYREILNTDSRYYGGNDVGNGGGLRAEPTPAHGYAQSLSLTLPPLATVLLQPA